MPRLLLETHQHPKYPRLHLDLRADSRFFQARVYLEGRVRLKSTKSESLPTAFRIAEDWLKRELRAAEAEKKSLDRLGSNPTLSEIFSTFKAQLTPIRKIEAAKRWNPISDFWRPIIAADVTSKTFREFYLWRRSRGSIKSHTIHKDVALVRQLLRYAMEEGIINDVPSVPKIGTIEENPRPWFTRSEWDKLLDISTERILDAEDNPKLKQQREDLDDQIRFMVGSMCRVDEMLGICYRDGRIEKNAAGEKILICAVSGKRGQRTVVGRTAAAAVFARRAKSGKPNDRLFPVHHRDAFRELLIAAGLRTDQKTGFTRNFKSLRATAISFEILGSDTPNLLLIARNAGTSVLMIDKFYAQRLSAEMGKEILTARRRK